MSMDDFWLFRTCVRCIDKCPLEVVFEEDGTKKNVFFPENIFRHIRKVMNTPREENVSHILW